jgi:hypothetical protein
MINKFLREADGKTCISKTNLIFYPLLFLEIGLKGALRKGSIGLRAYGNEDWAYFEKEQT